MDDQDFVDITPHAALVRSICNQPFSWLGAIGELVDNAFDAGAKVVEITFGEKVFSIRDNGAGCKDPVVMATLGDRIQQRTTKSGTYGIGAKDAALWIGGESSVLTINTVHDGVSRVLTVNWQDLIESQKWRVRKAAEGPAEPGSVGTRVTISGVARNLPPMEETIRSIGYLYSPALKSGSSIVVRRGKKGLPEPVPRWALPKLEEATIRDEVRHVGTKTIRVYAGIVAEGVANDHPGLTYSHKFRVIARSSGDGCGDHNISRVCGFVELGTGWTLTKNKSAISRDRDREALHAEVLAALEPMLAEADRRAKAEKVDALRGKVQDEINRILFGDGSPDLKAKRGKGDKEGSIEPTGTGRKHRQARMTQPGHSFGNRAVHRVEIDYITGWHDGEPIGKLRDSKVARVQLYSDHPAVSMMIRENSWMSMLTLVESIIASHRHMADGRQMVLTATEEHETACGMWVAVARSMARVGTPTAQAAE